MENIADSLSEWKNTPRVLFMRHSCIFEMDRCFASSSTAADSARQLSSIYDVQRWLRTLTEATSTQKLESLRAAVNVLKKSELKQNEVRPLCKMWPVQRDDGKKKPLTQVILELKEHVIKAANELRADLEQHAQIATAGCAVLFVASTKSSETKLRPR